MKKFLFAHRMKFKEFVLKKRKLQVTGIKLFLSFFPFLIRQIRRSTIHRRKNLKYGLGLYQLPVLVSYPRSGTNWLRYIIESLTQQATPGKLRLIRGGQFAVDRAHSIKGSEKKYTSMILVLRDYRECMLRHHEVLWRTYLDVGRFLREQDVESPPLWYIENIRLFHQFQGRKILLYYEDLVADPSPSIRKLGEFLELSQERVLDFIENLTVHQQQSVQLYNQSHRSDTLGKTDKLKKHTEDHLSFNQEREFDQLLQFELGDLFEGYLSRYRSDSIEPDYSK